MKLVRRVSDHPSLIRQSRGGSRCPDIWETDTGDYVVIGEDVTQEVRTNLPQDADLSPSERAVIIDREVLHSTQKRLEGKSE